MSNTTKESTILSELFISNVVFTIVELSCCISGVGLILELLHLGLVGGISLILELLHLGPEGGILGSLLFLSVLGDLLRTLRLPVLLSRDDLVLGLRFLPIVHGFLVELVQHRDTYSGCHTKDNDCLEHSAALGEA